MDPPMMNVEELTETLRSRLIECGWRDKVATMCRDLIQKNGIENVNMDQIVSEVGQKARMSVPDKVRTEMLELMHGTTRDEKKF